MERKIKMDNKSKNTLTMTIAGKMGSGKSTLLYAIMEATRHLPIEWNISEDETEDLLSRDSLQKQSDSPAFPDMVVSVKVVQLKHIPSKKNTKVKRKT